MSACAHASLVSFASDRDSGSYTFTGSGRQIHDAADQLDPLLLLVDDDNGPLQTLVFETEFDADFLISGYQSVNVGGGVLHVYNISGSFAFLDRNTGAPLMTASFTEGSLTVLGTQGAWASTATIQVGDGAPNASIAYTWLGQNLPGYGLFTGQESVGLDDAAFTLTFLQSAQGFGVPIDQSGLPLDTWLSEGSFSGSAFFAPAPSSVALLALGGLVANRRKR
jgi:hypothetical protein